MTTFAKQTFDAVGYLRGRPDIPLAVLGDVIQRAAPIPPHKWAIDLGCGPGQMARSLATWPQAPFEKVLGVDPGQGMITRASSVPLGRDSLPIEYTVGDAEHCHWCPPGQASLVVAVQAAHWFNHPAAYRELNGILTPNGTLAYLGYGEFYLPEHPQSTPLIRRYMREKLGPYWEPGRRFVDNEYEGIPFPSGEESTWDTTSFHKIKYVDDPIQVPAFWPAAPDDVQQKSIPTERHPVAMERLWNRQELQGYLGTFSASHTFDERHPSNQSVAQTFGQELWASTNLESDDEKVTVRWPLTVLTMKKSS